MSKTNDTDIRHNTTLTPVVIVLIRGVGATELTKKKVKKRRTHIWALKMIAKLEWLLKAQSNKIIEAKSVNWHWEKENQRRRRLKKELTGAVRAAAVMSGAPNVRSVFSSILYASCLIVSQILISFLTFNSFIFGCKTVAYLFIFF